MNLLDKILGKENKEEEYFTRNRNKKILAKTTQAIGSKSPKSPK